MTETLSISDDFPTADEEIWRELVEKALKGRAPETLDSRTEHGLPVKALYRETDWRSASDQSGFPGVSPFVRGGRATKDQWLPWDIRQIVRHPDPEQAQAQVLEALEHGASSVEVWIDPSAEQGVCARSADVFAALIHGVDLELAPVAVEGTGEATGSGVELAVMLAGAIDQAKKANSLLAFNIDPIGALVRTGAAPSDASFGEDMAVALALAQDYPLSTCLRVDARPVHEAGGTEVQEIAYMAAVGAAYFRAAILAGAKPDDVARMTLCTTAVGGNYHLEIAKMRAMRRVWARVCEAFDASSGLRLQAVTSRRMLSARDSWSNLLRNSAACFAAGVGGADIVTARAFTDALGHPGSLARRMARNTQIIAQEESGLGKVADPAGGAWAFERLGEDMAQAAWSLFQAIEAEGGIVTSLQNGKFQEGVADARRVRRDAVARRKEWLTGVNDFPLLSEEAPTCEAVDSESIARGGPPPTGIKPKDRSFAALVAAIDTGATLADLLPDNMDGVECDPLWAIRLSEPYEALRDLADERREAGTPPRIFLATLGPLAEHSARLTYATNFFAAGGIEAVAQGDDTDTISAFRKSGCRLVCICGSDDRYGQEAAQTATALRGAGAGRIYLAGKPGANEAAYRSGGVDEFIHIGVNVIASLELAHAELGIPS